MKKITFLIFILIIGIINKVNSQCSSHDYDYYSNYFSKNLSTLNPIEGIWEVFYYFEGHDFGETYIVDYKPIGQYSIYRTNDKFLVCKVESNLNFDYEANNGTFEEANSKNTYIHKERGGTWVCTVELNDEGNYMVSQFNPLKGMIYKTKYVKVFPKKDDYKKVEKPISQISTGSGFAISTDGIIVTNYHVIGNAKKLRVVGINGNFKNALDAEVLISDKNNDLALIKINDKSFTKLGNIPFIIRTNTAKVGESVFVLGYPLLASMGDEIKLTNGIVSSNSGYQGDITLYQISVPVQPGNSGGPMFDNSGNLVGIINAKLEGAENASYAVKSSYLMNLINALPTSLNLQTISVVSKLSLTEQVEKLKKVVFIIIAE